MSAALLATAMVTGLLADAGPTGGVLIGFLAFVVILFVVFIGLVVLIIFGIRRLLRRRRG
jgi:hypothetical protein